MKYLLTITFLTQIYSCGDGEPENYTEIYPIDSVKLICEGIKSIRDKSTYTQKTYTLSIKQRLLLRLDKLEELSPDVIINEEKRMLLSITPVIKNSINNTTIKICPLTKNWMMLSTWYLSNPFSRKNKKWKKRGGDYIEEECIEQLIPTEDSDQNNIYFDISDWFTSRYYSAKTLNYGWVMIGLNGVEIYGDKSSTPPQMTWKAEFDDDEIILF